MKLFWPMDIPYALMFVSCLKEVDGWAVQRDISKPFAGRIEQIAYNTSFTVP